MPNEEGIDKGGRPYAEIDKAMFEKLCDFQCTMLEICYWFDLDDETINAWCLRTYGKPFSMVFKEKKGKGKVSLRRTQWQLAEQNVTMAIWLGKQYLGQTDKVENNGEQRITVVSDIKEEPEEQEKDKENDAD